MVLGPTLSPSMPGDRYLKFSSHNKNLVLSNELIKVELPP